MQVYNYIRPTVPCHLLDTTTTDTTTMTYSEWWTDQLEFQNENLHLHL
jgi:hypothetical protein